MNPFLDLPLPINTTIRLNLIPAPPAGKIAQLDERVRALVEVRRALNAWAYSR